MFALLLGGCGSIEYHLPGHTARQHTAPVTLAEGERRPALATPARLPAPGGFWLGLVSEDPAIVAVETVDSARGASVSTLVARSRGETTVHYVNRFTLPRSATDVAALPREELRARSLQGFRVRVGAGIPQPGSDTTTPHAFDRVQTGQATVLLSEDGFVMVCFLADGGTPGTEVTVRVPLDPFVGAGQPAPAPGTVLRGELKTHYLQLGTTTPREIGHSWRTLP